MAIEIIGMFAAGTGGTEESAAVIDIRQDGSLVGLDWDCYATLDATDESLAAELSFIATTQITTNDVRGRISSVSIINELLTSGQNSVSIQKFVPLLELQVFGGERLHIHLVATAGVTSSVRINLHFQMGPLTRRAGRRT